MLRRLLCSAPAGAFALLLLATSAAWAGMGQPSPGEMGLQGAATPVAEEIHRMYDFVNIIIVAIAVFVALLMVYVLFRFNERANPTPSTVTHNTILEVAWTVIPILILVAIAYYWTRISHVVLFWTAFILTRPLGATVGDFFDKPIAQGGLNISRPLASAIIAAFIIACILLIRQRPGSHPQGVEARSR